MRGEGGAGAQCGRTSRLYGTKEFSTIGDRCMVNDQVSSMPLPCECDQDRRWVNDKEKVRRVELHKRGARHVPSCPSESRQSSVQSIT
jgi:hypothetical protein